MATQFSSAVVLVVSTVLSSVAAFLFKVASKQLQLTMRSLLNRELIIGVFLYGISTVLTVIAYKGGELTVLVPLGSLNYIWATFLARRYLSEKMNTWRWLGIFAIVFGIALIGVGDLL